MNIKPIFKSQINEALRKLDLHDVKNAVAVVQHGNEWLLGLSTARDHREHKWCFPGGKLRPGEDAVRAAEREAKEEAGVKCKATSSDYINPKDKKTVFIHCKSTGKTLDEPNDEFVIFGWFTTRQMKGLKLHDNVLQVIEHLRRT